MTRRIERLGTVLPPRVSPASGYWESISFLDEHGFYLDADYDTALSRAGLKALADEDGYLYYAAISHPKGLFVDGVSPLGRDLLEILANEGFEGEVVDLREERVFVLAAGHLREADFDADVEAEFTDGDHYRMVA
jgi:hypothetical protein